MTHHLAAQRCADLSNAVRRERGHDKAADRIEATANVEPTAYRYIYEKDGNMYFYADAEDRWTERKRKGWHETPLYAHPPARNTDDQALLQEARADEAATEITTLRQQLADAREALKPFALQTALARAGRMTTQRVRRTLDDFDKARAIIAKIDATLNPGGNHG